MKDGMTQENDIKRSDFLSFGPVEDPVNANNDIFRKEGKLRLHEDGSLRENPSGFDYDSEDERENYTQHNPTTLAEDNKLVKLAAWVAFHFLPIVNGGKRVNSQLKKWAGEPLRNWSNAGKFSLAVLVVENYINKWRRTYKYYRFTGHREKKQISEKFDGVKFSGNGLSSEAGKARYAKLLEYFEDNLYGNSPEAHANMARVEARYQEMVEQLVPDHVRRRMLRNVGEESSGGEEEVETREDTLETQAFKAVMQNFRQCVADANSRAGSVAAPPHDNSSRNGSGADSQNSYCQI